jgi:predicted nucleic acid-binding protein
MLATAHEYEATFWTQDAHFEDIAGVKYVQTSG